MVPIRIQLRGSSSAWAQAVNSLSGWSSCLFAMWRTLDFHLATIRSSKPGMVDCALQYKWLRTAFSHSWIISHAPFLFARLPTLFADTFVHMPDVVEMLCILLFGPDPLCYPSMSITNKNVHLKTRFLEKFKRCCSHIHLPMCIKKYSSIILLTLILLGTWWQNMHKCDLRFQSTCTIAEKNVIAVLE